MRYGICLLAVMAAALGCKEPFQQHHAPNAPPSQMLMHPGPGVDGPGPGVMAYQPAMPRIGAASQISFEKPEGMQISWDVSAPGAFDGTPLICPGRYNFPQGAIYRLKLTNIAGRPGVELYPTLEVGPALPRSEAFLAHNAIPVVFTAEDFDQVLSGNFVTKVIYLPDPKFQELATAGVDTLVSTRLDPGVDPIVEADRRGAIMAVVRLGNKDLQVPGSVQAAAYGGPMGPYAAGSPAVPSNYISGVNGPMYGMPSSGTPIGLPGPPHVPLGVPAGLQKHKIVNHTHVNLPPPTQQVRVDVKQQPGLSYPAPANHVRIVERNGGLINQMIGPTGQPCPQPCPQPGQAGQATASSAEAVATPMPTPAPAAN